MRTAADSARRTAVQIVVVRRRRWWWGREEAEELAGTGRGGRALVLVLGELAQEGVHVERWLRRCRRRRRREHVTGRGAARSCPRESPPISALCPGGDQDLLLPGIQERGLKQLKGTFR
jgi:hypothetical protein